MNDIRVKLLAVAVLVGLCWWALSSAYRWGEGAADMRWNAKWSDQQALQAKGLAAATTANRTEEQRRQTAVNQVGNDARRQQAAATADAVSADIAGEWCGPKPQNFLPDQAAPPAIPQLPNEARQPPAPQWCSPTCSCGLTRERESWQGLMTQPN